jgi:predicted GNAT superfamily acetyltransferase
MSTTIRDATDIDMELLLEINNAAVPNVNLLDIPALKHLGGQASYFRVAINNDQLAGFLIALEPAADYHSQNFTWFRQQFEAFVYIDRVVVAKPFRGLGIGRVFYADIQSHAEQIAPMLACEVNLEPRNDVSLLFHGTSGFHEVGQQLIDGGNKRVSLLAKELPSYAFVRGRYAAL